MESAQERYLKRLKAKQKARKKGMETMRNIDELDKIRAERKKVLGVQKFDPLQTMDKRLMRSHGSGCAKASKHPPKNLIVKIYGRKIVQSKKDQQ